MAGRRAWESYSPTYRAREVRRVAGWIEAGLSGSVVGPGGSGKSNFLGYLCHRPDALQAHLSPGSDPVAVILVDLNNLPATNLSTFYRVLLRAFFEARTRFDPELQAIVSDLFLRHQAVTDPFVSQTALRELLLACRTRGLRVVLVLDRFDSFLEKSLPRLTDGLRGLRDSFKDQVCLIVGMRQELAYLADPTELGELFEVLDTQVCWIGPMGDDDARELIAEETHTASPPSTEADVSRLLALTGGYPALLKAACHWWQSSGREADPEVWLGTLTAQPSVQFRLAEIWDGLTQAEQLALSEVQGLPVRVAKVSGLAGVDAHKVRAMIVKAIREVEQQHRPALARLEEKQLVERAGDGWRIAGELLAHHVGEATGHGRGTIWRDGTTSELFQGQQPIAELPNLERRALGFFLDRPRACVTKTDIITHVWPDEVVKEGVFDDALYQVITGLRRKIEPLPSKPCYLVTWRGKPEGGYQFFPEGRPGGGG